MIELIFKILHFLSFSALFGSVVNMNFSEEKKITLLMRISGIVTLLSGLGLFLFEGIEEGFSHFATIGFAVKMIFVAISALLSFIQKGRIITNKEARLHLIILAIIIIVAVAFL